MKNKWEKYKTEEQDVGSKWGKYKAEEEEQDVDNKWGKYRHSEPLLDESAPPQEPSQESWTESPLMGAVTGINTAVENVTHGLMQPVLESGLLGENLKSASQSMGQERLNEYLRMQKKHPISTTLGRVGGGIGMYAPAFVTGAGAAGSASQLARLPTLLRSAKNIGKAGLGGAATGAAEYVNPGESRAQNALMSGLWSAGIGAGIGGAGALYDLAKKGITKFKSALKGVYKPELQDMMEAAKKYGVDVLPGDISRKGGVTRLSEFSEKVPGINILSAREKQAQQAFEAAQKLSKDQQQKMIATEFGGPGGLEKLKKVAESSSKRSGRAKEILEEIENSGDDWNKIIQTSGNVSLLNKKLKADSLSEKVTNLAREFGDVPERHTTATVKNALQELTSSRIPDKGTVKILQEINEAIKKPQDYSGLLKFRSSINNILQDYYKGQNALIGSEGAVYIQRVKNAIEKDLDIFARSKSPELKKAHKEFMSYYKNELVPYKDRQLANALKNADADTVYDAFIKRNIMSEGKGHHRAKRFYQSLDPKGREAVKTGVIQHAVEKAINVEKNSFSPAIFASELRRNQPAKTKFFNEKELKDLEGFSKLMRQIERAGQTKSPETGVKAVPYLIGGAASLGTYLSPLIGTGILGSTYALKKIMSSPSFAKFLAAPSELKSTVKGKSPQGITSKITDVLEE